MSPEEINSLADFVVAAVRGNSDNDAAEAMVKKKLIEKLDEEKKRYSDAVINWDPSWHNISIMPQRMKEGILKDFGAL
jgi:hypothetical protein